MNDINNWELKLTIGDVFESITESDLNTTCNQYVLWILDWVQDGYGNSIYFKTNIDFMNSYDILMKIVDICNGNDYSYQFDYTGMSVITITNEEKMHKVKEWITDVYNSTQLMDKMVDK